MAVIDASISNLLTQFFSSLLYGIFLITFFQCLLVLCRPNPRTGARFTRPASKAMVVIAILLALVATVDNIVNLVNNIFLYELLKDASQSTQDRFWKMINYISELDIVLATALGDGILLYRVWVVYPRSYKHIAVPFLFCKIGFVSAILIIYYQSKMPAYSNGVSPLKELIIVCWGSTVISNLTATGLLVRRILQITKPDPLFHGTEKSRSTPSTPSITSTRSDHERRKQYNRVIRIIVESGLLYTVTATANGVSWILGTKGKNVRGILGALDVQMIGIAFGLLTIRVYTYPRRPHRAGAPESQDADDSVILTTGAPQHDVYLSTMSFSGPHRDLESQGSDVEVQNGTAQDEEGKRSGMAL